jgi:hypothetical protein
MVSFVVEIVCGMAYWCVLSYGMHVIVSPLIYPYRVICFVQNRLRDKESSQIFDSHVNVDLEDGDITDGVNHNFRYAM